MTTSVLVTAAGGIALFLLAMLLMTDGLRTFAGRALRGILARWTATPARGVLTGILVTGILQSSSAVTVATIGFVNAGVLGLRQALGVIFGTNVGTTMTGWLVSLVGFGFKIEALALPILTAGVALRLAGGSERRHGLGMALAGFGLFFLGLAFLRDAFGGLTADVQPGNGTFLPAYLAAGFVVTVLTQSSSAAIAIILTAAAGGVLPLAQAAVAVIGANLGTTSTAALAVIGATAPARRLALGHIAFNVVTALVALAILPLMLWLVGAVADWLDLEGNPAALLALFHTAFNLLGVAILLPLTGPLTRFLEQRFRTAGEDLARPRHLDATVAGTPELAVPALRAELARLLALVATTSRDALRSGPAAAGPAAPGLAAAASLADAIAGFVASVRPRGTSRGVADDLAIGLRASRHFREATQYMAAAAALGPAVSRLRDPELRAQGGACLDRADNCLRLILDAPAPPSGDGVQPPEDGNGAAARVRAAHMDFATMRDRFRTALLRATVEGHLDLDAVSGLLDDLNGLSWLMERLVEGHHLLVQTNA